MPSHTLPRKGIVVFQPPYRDFGTGTAAPGETSFTPGAALVWFIAPGPHVIGEMAQVRQRDRSLPLFIVLPEPEDILPVAPLLRAVPDLRPRGVLPSAGRNLLPALRSLLAAPPHALPVAIADQLELAGVLKEEETRQRIETIFAAAPRITSIESLAAAMCQSRRTLGRHFRDRGLPVPSHWLQFARILHVAIQIQNTNININRVASRFGYPDGFTMSNSMKRLTGYRPTFVRDRLGWEWIVEAWLQREGLDG